MRVLYIDAVGAFGGASRSLYETLRAMPPGSVAPHFVVQRGTVLPFYREVAHDVIGTRGLTRFDNTRYSHYRGVRWLVPLRELLHLPFGVAALLTARLRWRRVDVIHVNEVTDIVPALLAKWLFRAPLVVHVRSLTRDDPRSRRVRWLTGRLRAHADAVIAIDENVRATLPADLPVDVVHNSFATRPPTLPDPVFLQRLASLPAASLRVGFVGNLHESKGLLDLLEAARIVKEAGRDVQFVVVGGATRPERGPMAWALRRLGLAQSIRTTLDERIARYGLAGTFHLMGPTSDIQGVYERIDVLCFPSHFDAPGRPVLEAALYGVPSITAVRAPRPDTLVDGETGIAVSGQDPVRLAGAIIRLADRPAEVERLGEGARRLAERNFDAASNARRLLAVYQRVMSAGGRRSRPAPASS